MTAKAREPTRNKKQKEKAFALWIELGGNNAPRGTLSKIAKSLNVTDGTVRGWKNKEKWEEKSTQNTVNFENVATKDKKKEKVIKNKKNVATEEGKNNSNVKIIEANDMFLHGKSATEIAKKINVSISTVTRWRTKYKWVEEKERLILKVTNKLYQKYKKERFKERESSYKHAALIRIMTMQKLTGKEFVVRGQEKEYLPRLTGKALAAEISAMSLAVKVLEDTNKYQDSLLGIKEITSLMNDIVENYKFETRQEIEREKIQVDKTRVFGNSQETENVMSALKLIQKRMERDMLEKGDKK